MTFVIDTGPMQAPKTAVDFIPDWLLDQCDPSYSDAQKVQCYAHHLMGHMSAERGDERRPKRLDTIREHFVFAWPFLRCLSTENPGLFDEVLTAYVERVWLD